MINFTYNTDYELSNDKVYMLWLEKIIKSEDKLTGDIEFIFCSDNDLLKINQDFLHHDYFTDIITFDYVDGKTISGDVFISVDRLRENADSFKVSFEEELHRVMSHGVLHLLGFGDKTEEESRLMRFKEEEKMKLFHVEQ